MALLNIGGVDMPAPTELTISVNDISKADRNANGTMVLERIATKQKLQLKWSYISDVDLKTVLNAISPTMYQVTYTNPLTNTSQSKQMYCGDRTAGVMYVSSGVVHYKDFGFDLIEI